MIYKRFRFQLLWRILALFAVTWLCVLLWQSSTYPVTALLCTALLVFMTVSLLNYVDRTNRELARFVSALECSDFSQTFSMSELGGSFRHLGNEFHGVMERFRETRMEREEALQFSQMVMKQIPVALLVVDEGGRIKLSNDNARRLLGISPLLHINDLSSPVKELYEYLSSSEQPDQKLISVLLHGSTHQLMVSTTYFIDRGIKKRVVCLQNIRSELDRQEVQAWQDLIRVLSHEIMNSITPISSLSHSAADAISQLDEENRSDSDVIQDVESAVKTVARRSDGLLQFVENYRQIARLPKPHPQFTNARQIIAQSLSLMEKEFEGREIQIDVQSTPNLPELFVDEQMLIQALVNLLHNAQDAIDDGVDGVITISAVYDFQGKLTITVTDNGCGIDEGELKKVWLPFYTLKENGSGIGLSLVRQIVLAHRGTVQIRSTPRNGTSVSLEFHVD